MFSKTLAISLAPNNFTTDIQLSLKTIINPSLWLYGYHINLLEDKFRQNFKVKYAFSFNTYETVQGGAKGYEGVPAPTIKPHVEIADEPVGTLKNCNVNPSCSA